MVWRSLTWCRCRARPDDRVGDTERHRAAALAVLLTSAAKSDRRKDATFAVRCIPGVGAGPISSAGIANWSVQSEGPLHVTLGPRRYEVSMQSVRDDLTDAQIVLAEGGRRQVLYSADGFVDEPHFEVEWAGDLDRDGRLDLTVNLHRKYSWHPYRLLLSSMAAAGQLVGDAALFETGD